MRMGLMIVMLQAAGASHTQGACGVCCEAEGAWHRDHTAVLHSVTLPVQNFFFLFLFAHRRVNLMVAGFSLFYYLTEPQSPTSTWNETDSSLYFLLLSMTIINLRTLLGYNKCFKGSTEFLVTDGNGCMLVFRERFCVSSSFSLALLSNWIQFNLTCQWWIDHMGAKPLPVRSQTRIIGSVLLLHVSFSEWMNTCLHLHAWRWAWDASSLE